MLRRRGSCSSRPSQGPPRGPTIGAGPAASAAAELDRARPRTPAQRAGAGTGAGLSGLTRAWALAAWALVACGSEGAAADASLRQPGPAATTAPAAIPVGDVAVIAVRRLPASLDPTAELDPWGQRIVDDLLFEGLTRRLADAPWSAPALAERCLVDQDGRGVACQLRAGARFHDDAPVTVDDLLYSINLWLGARGANLRQRYGLDDLRSVEAGPPAGQSGEGWVRIGFAQRDPLVLERLAAVKIVPKAKHSSAARWAHNPIGTGPMRLVSQAEDRWLFARPEAIPGRVTQLELRATSDGAAALTALRRGEIHLLPELAPAHVPRELGKPGMAARFVAFLLSPPRYDVILYNLHEGPQAGPRMRSALDLAIPRVEIAGAVHGEPGLPVVAPVDLHVPTAIDLVAIADNRIAEAGLGPYGEPPAADADAAGLRAADLVLTELGWLDNRGQRRRGTAALRVPLTWDGSPGVATGTARALRAAWKQIGVQAPSVTAGWAYVLSLLRGRKFSLALARLAGSSDMDLSPWFHSHGANNLSGVADGELDTALERYRHAGSRAERDAAKRGVAARLAQLHPVSVLHAPVQVLLASRALTGLEFIDDLPRLDTLGLDATANPAGLRTFDPPLSAAHPLPEADAPAPPEAAPAAPDAAPAADPLVPGTAAQPPAQADPAPAAATPLHSDGA